MQLIDMSSKTFNEKILTVAFQNYAKNQLQKAFLKPFLIVFPEFFRDIFQTDLIQMLKQF